MIKGRNIIIFHRMTGVAVLSQVNTILQSDLHGITECCSLTLSAFAILLIRPPKI